MPSYRYTRDIKPEDLAPEQQKEYTKKQKAKNWWQYHWYWFAVGAVVIGVVTWFVMDITRAERADVTVGIVAPYNLPETVLETLSAELEAYAQDVNGDGKVVVQIELFTVTPYVEVQSAVSDISQLEPEDPYAQMAGVTRLAGAVSTDQPVIFLLEPESAQYYQDNYALLGGADTRQPQAGTPVEEVSITLGQLQGLNAEAFIYETPDGLTVDVYELLADWRLGIRAFEGTKLADKEESTQKWQAGMQLLQRLGFAL